MNVWGLYSWGKRSEGGGGDALYNSNSEHAHRTLVSCVSVYVKGPRDPGQIETCGAGTSPPEDGPHTTVEKFRHYIVSDTQGLQTWEIFGATEIVRS